MADGSVIFDTKLDTTGVIRDLSSLATGSLKAAAAGLAALGTYAISVGSDFEAAISGVAATMGKTTDQIADITAKAKELGATTAFSATQAAEGFNILAQSGLTMEEQLASIDSVLGLAAAGEMQMSDAAGYLTTTVKAFSSSAREANLSMADTTRLADLYAKGATLANTSTAQFGDAMTGAASMAGSFNQSIDTTGTLLLALAEKGYQGSAAGTYLSRAMSDLYSPTEQAQKALDALGVSAYDSSGSQRDMIDVIGDLQTALSGMTEEEQAAYTASIFTSAGLKAFNSIAGSSQEELEALKSSLIDCTGAAERMAAVKLDNLQGDITILKSATEGFGIAIYENMQKPLRSFVQEATGIMDDLHQAVEEGGLSGLAGAVGKALSRAINMVAQYAPKLAKAAVDLVSSFVNGIADAAPQLATVAIDIGTTLLSGILTISADLIRLGGELIIALCNGIVENIGQIGEAVTSGLSLIASTIVEYLPQVVQAGIQVLGALAEGLIEAAPQLIETALSLITELAGNVADTAGTFIDAATGIIDALVATLPQVINALLSALPGLIDAVVSGITTLAPKIVTCGVNLLTSLVKGMPQIIQSIVSKLPEIISSIVGGLLSMLPLIVDCGVQLLVALVQALPDIIYQIVAVLPQIISSIVQTLVGMTGQIIACGIQLLTSLVAALPQIITTIVAVLPSIVMAIVSALIDMIPQLIQCGIELLTSLITALPDIIAAIVAAMPTIIAAVINALVSNIGLIVECGIQLFTSLITALPQIISTIIASIPQIISSIVQAIVGARGQIVEAGRNLLTGMADGIGSAIGSVVARAREAASRVVSSVKGFFGIASPSKLFKNEIGKNLMLGLAGGIDDAKYAAINAAEGAAEDIADVDFDPSPDFDFGGVDYGALLSKATSAVQAARNATGKAISGDGSYTGSGKDGSAEKDGDKDNNKPKYVLVENSIDGKVFARVTAPYMEKELDWRDE